MAWITEEVGGIFPWLHKLEAMPKENRGFRGEAEHHSGKGLQPAGGGGGFAPGGLKSGTTVVAAVPLPGCHHRVTSTRIRPKRRLWPAPATSSTVTRSHWLLMETRVSGPEAGVQPWASVASGSEQNSTT